MEEGSLTFRAVAGNASNECKRLQVKILSFPHPIIVV